MVWVPQEKQIAACHPAWVVAAPHCVRVVTGQLAAEGVQ